jgi:hypothetical protein
MIREPGGHPSQRKITGVKASLLGEQCTVEDEIVKSG